MIELGIAIKLNKNVLILSGVYKDKIPFDISGLHIDFYKNETDLKKKIKEFLNIYVQIKEMTFDNPVNGSYFHNEETLTIRAHEDTIKRNDRSNHTPYVTVSPALNLPRMKDLKISVEYRIIERGHDSNWFGFLLRAPVNYD